MSFDFDQIVENHFKEKRDIFGFESIVQLIEEAMQEWGDGGKLLGEDTIPQLAQYTFEMIPAPSVNELGWGALATPADKKKPVPLDPHARRQLSQYLEVIGGADLEGKVKALNRFFAGHEFPGPSGGPGNQLKKTIAYLVTFKSLTQIITNFNAASAGFTFEAFLAVLLDAETGRQIKAAGATTIADIVVYKGGRPISVKLYAEGSLKVGGSYKALIGDLTGGEHPAMEYVAVTKDIQGEGPEAVGNIQFFSFQFTANNVAQILALGNLKNKILLQIPAVFADVEELKRQQGAGELEAHLHLPEKGHVDTAPLVDNFYARVREGALQAGISQETVGAIAQGLSQVIDQEARQPVPGIKTISAAVDELGLTPEERAPLGTPWRPGILKQALKAFTEEYAAEKKAGTPRAQAFQRRAYLGGDESVAVLNKLAADGEGEILLLALQNTLGMTGKPTVTQFELSQSQLETLPKMVGKTNEDVFPYGRYRLGSIELGVQNVQDMLDRSVNAFNAVVFQIFSDLKVLSTSLNGYVASGLEKTELAKKAFDAATDIAEGTEEIQTRRSDPRQMKLPGIEQE